MRILQTLIVIAALLLSLGAGAEDKQTRKGMNKIEPLPRDLEIQLALSALPSHLRDNATVYVLNPDKGFEVARKGTNGFHTFVARTGDDSFRGSWPLTAYRDDILYPVSFDAAGAKEQMRVFFDAAEMQAGGTPPGELKRFMKDRSKTGYYKAPERAGVSYMVSPILRTYINPEENDTVATSNNPHVMYYAPGVSNEDIGGKPPSIRVAGYGMMVTGPYPFVIMPGHHGYMIQLLGLTERAAICLFRRNVATRSEANWPPIPIHCGRPFRSNLATPERLTTLDNPFLGHYPLKKRFRRSQWQPGDYPCAKSKKYYVFIMKKVSRPVRLLEASILGAGLSKTTLPVFSELG